MTILCGTDFSEASQHALRAAAAFAARMKQPLHVAHVLEQGIALAPDPELEARQAAARERLAQWSARAQLPVAGQHVAVGKIDDALGELAQSLGAGLIVIGAHGERAKLQQALGRNADRLARRAQRAVLVVRDSGPLERWQHDGRALRITVGADQSRTSDAAIHWLRLLRAAGPCEVTALHLYWPPQQFERLGLVGVHDYAKPHPEVEKALTRELRERFGESADRFALRLEPHMGWVGDRLAQIAEQLNADLVVVGSHGRAPLSRVWLGSASHAVLHRSRASVVCVPADASATAAPLPFRSALVATDFSELGNAAVPLAYSALPQGGTVYLVHVVRESGRFPTEPHDLLAPTDQAQQLQQATRIELLRLCPRELGPDFVTQAYVLASNDTADAIVAASERLGADVVCLGTHGRSAVVGALLGSVAQSVLHKARRPVLFTRHAGTS